MLPLHYVCWADVHVWLLRETADLAIMQGIEMAGALRQRLANTPENALHGPHLCGGGGGWPQPPGCLACLAARSLCRLFMADGDRPCRPCFPRPPAGPRRSAARASWRGRGSPGSFFAVAIFNYWSCFHVLRSTKIFRHRDSNPGRSGEGRVS